MIRAILPVCSSCSVLSLDEACRMPRIARHALTGSMRRLFSTILYSRVCASLHLWPAKDGGAGLDDFERPSDLMHAYAQTKAGPNVNHLAGTHFEPSQTFPRNLKHVNPIQ